MTDKVFYRTFDVDLAVTLYTSGIPISGIYTNNTINRKEFYFENDDKLTETIKNYFSHNLLLDPYLLLNNRKDLMMQLKYGTNTQKPIEATS